MKKIYYKKAVPRNNKRIARLTGLGLIGSGLLLVLYIFYPILSWSVFYAPLFAAQNIVSPIPNLAYASVKNVATQVLADTNQVDYTNAKNWFPAYAVTRKSIGTRPTYYTISIPKIRIQNALVSTKDNDLSIHMVNYGGTAIPTENGTAVVFGHSTLPQLYDPTNYKTVLSNAYTLRVGDIILVSMHNSTYTYTIYSTTVVDPDDVSVFSQQTDDSYITLVTCTPPGTILYRLVIRAKLQHA